MDLVVFMLATCGGGQRTRKRFCIPSKGISDCGGFMEHAVVCNNISCPGKTHVLITWLE